MSTVLGFEVFPLRDELQKIGSMSSFGGLSSTASQHHQRRTGSGSVVSTTSHGSSSNHHQHPVLSSTLEDSGNANNRGILQSSQSSSHHQQQPQRYGVALSTTADYRNDSSTVVNIHTGSSSSHGAEGAFIAEALIVKRTSSLSLLQKQPSSATLENNINKNAASNSDSNDAAAAADSGADRIVEEKRKRAVGDGYSIHRYTLGRLLGKGGFAKVYLCTAMDTGKNYAVKVVPKANLVKTRARQKLQAEIKIHRNLRHRYVCQYKHYFEDRTNCYILLELCHNQSLNEMIKRRKRLTEPEAAYFMKQILEATRYMHDQNVIHRDLKLGNLFLDRDMLIKVGDLGLATRVEDKDEKRKTICGTPNYIAPEIIQGDKAKRGHSFEVDVWSMGVILYTVLIGKPPYEAKDVKATYQRILDNEYSFPRHIEISPSAKSLIQALLQTLPTDRPTLDEIDVHPFLAESHIPMFLPTTTLTFAPVWRVNEYGEMVCTDSAAACKKPSIPRPGSGRQPFASRDPNTHKAPSATSLATSSPRHDKDVINMERVVRTAVAAMTSGSKHPPPSQNPQAASVPKALSVPGFTIFDETSRKPPAAEQRTQNIEPVYPLAYSKVATATRKLSQEKPVPLTEEALCEQTRLLYVGTGFSSRQAVAPPPSCLTHVTESVFSSTDNDVEILHHMVEHLDTVINITESRKGSYRPLTVRPIEARRSRGPTKWVTRYVDYTSKYGLGFLLNDGCSGVYFNDSTKTALEPSGETFQYIERKRSVLEDEGCTPSKRRGEMTIETYTVESYPEPLKKKVTLLKHFRNYLMQQESNEDDNHNRVQPEKESGVVNQDLVYVKKWVRTKHAILFSLSNRTIQVIFYDQTEILLTPDVAFLTFVDKHRNRLIYDFSDELVGSCNEIEKRLKYTKEIMLQLLSGQRS